jgi:hypothetical protein
MVVQIYVYLQYDAVGFLRKGGLRSDCVVLIVYIRASLG